MSTYITRVIEVKIPEIDYKVWKEEDISKLPESLYFDGLVCKVNSDRKTPYRIWHREGIVDNETEDMSCKGSWEKSDNCKWHWELVRFWTNKNDNQYMKYNIPDTSYETHEETTPLHIDETGTELIEVNDYTDNGGAIRDRYISRFGNEFHLNERGLPNDISDDAKAIIDKDNEYSYGYTYVLLSEYQSIFQDELTKFEENVKQCLKDIKHKEEFEIINKKLDILLSVSKLNNTELSDKNEDAEEEFEDNPEETINYLFDENLWDLIQLNDEICKVSYLVNTIYGYFIPEDNIRINYYFS